MFVEVAAEGAHSCGRVTSGAVYCWGLNNSGQLGDGTFVNRPTPTVPVTGGHTLVLVQFGTSTTASPRIERTPAI